MNILFVLDYYLPKASPNGVCVEKVANKFRERGDQVSILAFGQSENYMDQNGVKVYYCNSEKWGQIKKSRLYPFYFYAKWLMPSKYPVYERKVVTKEIVQKADEIIRKDKIDVVVCVHLPIESLIAGVELKRRFPTVKFIAYALDSFSGGFLPRYLPECFCRHRKIMWENRIYTSFDKIVLMRASESHHEWNSKSEAWYQRAEYLDIPLFDARSVNKSGEASHKEKIIVLFSGLLNYPYRNVLRFLELISMQEDDGIEYIFVGETNVPEMFKNRTNVSYLGYVEHERVEELLNAADVLLNLGVNNPNAISGKIFEYMQYRKPIISTYSIDNEACLPYLEKYPISLLIDERKADIGLQSKSVNEFILEYYDKRVDAKYLDETFTRNKPDAFVNTLTNN